MKRRGAAAAHLLAGLLVFAALLFAARVQTSALVVRAGRPRLVRVS